MNIQGAMGSIERNLDKIGILYGYTSVFGAQTLEIVMERASREFHVPDLGSIRYFLFEHADTRAILTNGLWMYLIGEVAKSFGGKIGRIGRGASKLGAGIITGGLLWILTLSTHFRHNSPLTPGINSGLDAINGKKYSGQGLVPNLEV